MASVNSTSNFVTEVVLDAPLSLLDVDVGETKIWVRGGTLTGPEVKPAAFHCFSSSSAASVIKTWGSSVMPKIELQANPVFVTLEHPGHKLQFPAQAHQVSVEAKINLPVYVRPQPDPFKKSDIQPFAWKPEDY